MPVSSFLMPLADGVPLFEGARWVYELSPQDMDRKLFYMRTNHVVLSFLRRPEDTTSPGPLETPSITEAEGAEAAKPEELMRVHQVGFFSRVKWSPDTTKITFYPQIRVQISNVRALSSGMIGADIKPLEEPVYSPADQMMIRGVVDQIAALIRSMLTTNANWSLVEQAKDFLDRLGQETPPDPVVCLSIVCNLLSSDTLSGIVDFQRLVGAVDARERAKIVLEFFTVQEALFSKYHDMHKQSTPNQDEARQKEVYQSLLQEAQQEMGSSADAERTKLIEKFRKRLEGLTVPKDAMNTIEEQISRMSFHEPSQSEYGLTVAYLDILTQLPWGIYTQDNFDIEHAKSMFSLFPFTGLTSQRFKKLWTTTTLVSRM